MKKIDIFSNLRTSLISILILTSLFGSIAIFGQAAQANLIMHLPLDEGTGTTANDNSGNGNVGVVNGASWITGVCGKALEFDGINDNLIVNNTDLLESVNALTIAFWVKISYNASLKYYIMTSGFGLFQHGNETGLAIHLPSTNNAKTPIMLDVWKQITGTYDGTDIKIYVDGVLADTQN